MRCRSCMTDNPSGNRFCESCGMQLQQACAKCGHDVGAAARFCGNCGTGVQPPLAVSESTPKWGELKQATVLFADIVGSTDMVAHIDPEQAMARLRPAVLRMRHSVERFGGTVLRTLGDGVMAMFGVPRSLEGHALLACQAALHMQAAFKQGGEGLQIRVGLHCGQVASDPEDAEDGRGGGAHGLTIHLASRVIALAQPGGICITQAVRNAAGPGCESHAMGPHQLKGIPLPVEIFGLAGAVSTAPHRPLTPETTFRGRERELAQLVGALDSALDGKGGTIGVSGDPGAGKTRLCRELAQVCAARGVPVHEVRAQLYGHALPLQPILELFRAHFFGIGPRDDPATARERISARFEPVAPNAQDLQLLHEFFGVAVLDASPVALGPRARQSRLLALVRALVKHEAQVARVIVIEDLHWLDEASEEFVSAMVGAVAGTRTLLLLNYRSAYSVPWLGAGYFTEVPLAELAPPDMDALVAELLAPVTALPDVCKLVCRRAGGNPFFAEELVRTLAESHLISMDSGLPEGGLEAVEKALPATIEAVIGARLDRIGEPEKTLLQMCAIIGKDIPLAVLEHVASTPLVAHVQLGLDGLCRAGLILPQPAEGGRRFAFRHPLIQEVAYGTQLKVRRSLVHANVAAAMELYYAEQLDEYAGLIAYHFEQAQKPLEAARYNARAAAWVGTSSSAQAIRHWRKVRSLLEQVEPTPEIAKRRADAGAKIATLGWREGMTLDEVKPLIDEAVQFATQGDDRLVPWLLTIEGRMLVASGGCADRYVELVHKALLYIDVDRDRGRVSLAHAFLGQALAWAGRLREALEASEVALAHVAHVHPYDRDFIGFSIEQWILSVRTRVLVRMGRLDEAAAALDSLREFEATAAEPALPGMTHMCSIELAWARDDMVTARRHAAELQRVADKFEMPYLRIFIRGYQGLAAMVQGQHAAARNCYADALAELRRSGAAREFETELLAGLAECALNAGEFDDARRYAHEAVELSRLRSTRIAHSRALIVRARAHAALETGDAARCEADLAEAASLIADAGASVFSGLLDHARSAVRAVRAA